MRKITPVSVVIVALLATAALMSMGVVGLHAAIPRMINYHGKITDLTGAAVPDGDYSMKFYLYDALTGGTLIWGPEEWSVAAGREAVAVNGGLFTVLLGKHVPLPAETFGDTYWLEMWIKNESEVWEMFDPRGQWASAPYSFCAEKVVDGAIDSAALAIDSITEEKIVDEAITDGKIAASGLSAGKITMGTIDSARIDWGEPGAIGETTPAEGRFSTLSVDGNVGIGTMSSTLANLHVVGDGTAGVAMVSPDNSSSGGESTLWLTEDDDGTYGMRVMFKGADDRLYIYGKASSTEYGPHLTIKRNDGNVGIGMNEPAYKLDVNGDLRLSGILRDGQGDGGTSGQLLQSTGTTIEWVDTSNIADNDWTISGDDVYRTTGNVGVGVVPDTTLHVSGRDNDGTTAALKITSGGQSMLLDGNEIDAGTELYLNNNSSTDVIIANGGGKVGIGTGSPQQALELNGNLLVGIGQDDRFVHGGNDIAFSADGDVLLVADANDIEGVAPGGDIVFGSGSAVETNSQRDFSFASAFPATAPRNEHMRITGEGSVGIGTTEPGLHLHVRGTSGLPSESGTAQNGALRLQYSGGTGALDMGNVSGGNAWLQVTDANNLGQHYDLLLNPNGGNVGIGITNPSQSLEVNGDTHIGGGSGSCDGSAEFIGIRSQADSWYIGAQNEASSSDTDFFIGLSSTEDGTFHIEHNGKIGIGTTSPSGMLSIVKPVGIIGNPSTVPGLTIHGGILDEGNCIEAYNPLGDAVFVVDVSGRVGVGVSTPSSKLHVANPEIENTAGKHTLYLTESNNAESPGGLDPTKPYFGLGFRRAWNCDDMSNIKNIAGIYAYGVSGYKGGLVFKTEDGVNTDNPDTIAMVIEPDGEVGIGNTNPDEKLHVDGNGRFEGALAVMGVDDIEQGLTLSDQGSYKRIQSWGSTPLVLNSAGAGTGNNVGIGITNPDEKLHVDGSIKLTGGSDLSEPFVFNKPELIEPGMVVVIDQACPGTLKASSEAYDRCVAGIVSGAGGIRPGIMMEDERLEGDHQVALAGRVYALCDASYGAIQPGDLLTTSPTTGHAMKVSDHDKATGAIIGKAMTGLVNEKGLVLVLVSLQ